MQENVLTRMAALEERWIDIEISNAAIDLKTEIEKVREQIQNIE